MGNITLSISFIRFSRFFISTVALFLYTRLNALIQKFLLKEDKIVRQGGSSCRWVDRWLSLTDEFSCRPRSDFSRGAHDGTTLLLFPLPLQAADSLAHNFSSSPSLYFHKSKTVSATKTNKGGGRGREQERGAGGGSPSKFPLTVLTVLETFLSLPSGVTSGLSDKMTQPEN